MRPGEVKAVLFDLDGTLARSKLPPYERRLSTRLGVTSEVLLQAFKATRASRWTGANGSAEADMAAVVRACGFEARNDLVEELTADHLAFLVQGGVGWQDDALHVLETLRGRGIRTAVISNCDHWQRPVVDALAIQDKVDAVILSFEHGMTKPDARIYRLALDQLDVEPAQAIFVDDQEENCAGAEALGIHAYLVVDGSMDDLTRPRSVIRGLAELLAARASLKLRP